MSEIELKVYYEDTDCLGMVYHANYLKYFERARTEMVNDLGRPIHEWNQAGFNFVVYKVDVTFHKPARLADRLRVVTRKTEGSAFRLKLDQRVFRGTELLTEAMVHLVCLDAKLQLRELPAELRA